jgi:cell wall-associated NlpC family hydrolase
MRRITLCATAAVALCLLIPVAAPVEATNGAAGRRATSAEYTVQSGDYLLGIAKKLNVGFRDLLTLNQLTPTSPLYPGDVLRVPTTKLAAKAAPTAAAPPAAVSPTPAAQAPVSYTVQAGDALLGIAKRYGLKYGAILKLNGIRLDAMLRPGDTLLLPPGATPVAPAPPPSTVPATTVPVTPVPVTPVPVTTVPTPPAPAAAVPATTAPAPAPAATPIDTVVAFAKAQVGKPYRFFTAGPDTFDCSGLTLASYRQIGVTLTHQSLAQSKQGRAVDWTVEPIKAGDLVFMYSSRNPSVISHVGLAISPTRWVHAPRPGDVVREGPLPPASRIIAVRRFVET